MVDNNSSMWLIFTRMSAVPGRKSIEVPKLWDKYYKMYKENTIKAVDVMKILELKKTTFYKLINQYEESN
ncbi:hypothetical protein [Clostridium psychrophilum]|uniref:hypothetical protein n=1 Tax=Clostridium psychrophilum TaxID=132926 RepID=UPI001C0B071C|nr:hypothetical protein [Clostridium psychrophilum]MBU3182925.1 hypothetical protein [Clostridium psychrophilum]